MEIAADKAVFVVVLRMTVMAVVVTAGGVGSGGGLGVVVKVIDCWWFNDDRI